MAIAARPHRPQAGTGVARLRLPLRLRHRLHLHDPRHRAGALRGDLQLLQGDQHRRVPDGDGVDAAHRREALRRPAPAQRDVPHRYPGDGHRPAPGPGGRHLPERAPPPVRRLVKPVLEILAGIPTVIYGYFALRFISPEIVRFFFGSDVSLFNALSASIAMGVMILPLVSSLSEDAMRAVPQALREGAYAVGANRFEGAP